MTFQVSTLDNGLRIATDRVEHVETASIGVWVGVGTRHETADVNGVAHLLEHMAFKGTARRSAVAIAEEIEAVGGHLNAYTSRENTTYYARVLKDDLPLALDILADILQHSLLDPEELSRERAVVLQEIGQAVDTPDDIVFDHFQASAFPDQPLGRPVLGSPESVRQLSRDVVADYLRTRYGGPTMVLAAAGKVDHDALVDMAERAFGALPATSAGESTPAHYVGGHYREQRDLEQLHLVLGFEGGSYHDEDFYAESILSALLGGGMSSRLFQEVREKRGLAYSIYTFASYYADGGLFGVYAGTAERDVGDLVPVLCDEIAGVADTLKPEEVERARAQIRANVLMGLESTMARCEHLGHHMLVFGRPLPVAEVIDKLLAVTVDDIRRTARRILSGRPTVAAIGPTNALEPYDRIVARLA